MRASEALGRLGIDYDGAAGDAGAGPGGAGQAARAEDEPAGLPVSFRLAMDDDLSVPSALAAVHACVRDGNQALAASDKAGARASLVGLRAMLGVLGLDPLAAPWAGAQGGSGDRMRQVVGALVKLTLQQRDAARARRDYATSDAIRDGLEEIGVIVEDTPEGPRWELKR
jgi:cysteinyl-tRNA synthetase